MGDVEPEVEDATDEDPAGRLTFPLREMARGFPVHVTRQDLKDFCDDPSVAMLRAAAAGGVGTLVYTIGRPEGRPGFVPVAVILPVEEFRRLVLRGPKESE